ncbi:MAG: hybrid-cluster NAD(P)-dependent oxidoreductase [Neptuniibacter sp.]
MSETVLSGINIFPVKSLGGFAQSSSYVTSAGLAFDRRFMLATPDGDLLSARETPKMLLYKVLLKEDGIEVVSPDGGHLSLAYPQLFQNYRQVNVWGTEINAQHCGEQFDQWFTAQLGRPCQLLYFGEQSERYTSKRPEIPVGFADGYPLLLISEASLADLNSRSSAPVTMKHFRTNLVVKGCEPFEEDSWKRIRIGQVEFEVVKPCSRCVMTTVDPETADPITGGEPIKTLANYRKGKDNEVYFGQNLVALNEGHINEGDAIVVLEQQQAEVYPDSAPVINPITETPDLLDTWQADQNIELLCVRRVEETPDVVTFRFKLPDQLAVDYLAGQFITVYPSINGQEVSRCYTLSSSPSRSADITITVKRVTGGEVSNWLHKNLHEGDSLKATGPTGEFHVNCSNTPKLLLLSAGSGITPMLSIARYLSDTHSARDIVFYHQARTESDLICEDELLWLKRQNPNLKLIFSLSQPESSWLGIKGRISREQLIHEIPDLTERTVMCCGPEGFMQQAKDYCRQLGLAEQRWFEESFGKPPGFETLDNQVAEFTIEINGTTFKGDNQHPLLVQAELNGMPIAYGCRAGVCGVCKVKLVEGEVKRNSEIPLTEDEKREGIILACSCIPESDIKIEK